MLKKVLIVNIVTLFVLCLFTTIFHFQTQNSTLNTINEVIKDKSEDFNKNRNVVLLLGSSVTQGLGASTPQTSWAGLLNSDLSAKTSNLVFLNLGVGGYTTNEVTHSSLRIISNLGVANLTPDLIIFEICSINDFLKINSNQSKINIEKIVERLSKQFPTADISLMPPNDLTIYNNRVNSEGLSYQNYVSSIGDFIVNKGWDYIDFWDEYEKELNERGLTLNDTLLKDGKHPNDTGYKIWFNTIKQELQFNDF